MTHDFIHTSLYCRSYRLLKENVIKRGVTVVVFKISDLKNVNFASFLTRRYNGYLWKTHFLGLPYCIKTFVLQKRVTFFFQKLTQYDSMIEVYIKAKKWVCRRLIFRATVHKMPDLLFL